MDVYNACPLWVLPARHLFPVQGVQSMGQTLTVALECGTSSANGPHAPGQGCTQGRRHDGSQASPWLSALSSGGASRGRRGHQATGDHRHHHVGEPAENEAYSENSRDGRDISEDTPVHLVDLARQAGLWPFHSVGQDLPS